MEEKEIKNILLLSMSFLLLLTWNLYVQYYLNENIILNILFTFVFFIGLLFLLKKPYKKTLILLNETNKDLKKNLSFLDTYQKGYDKTSIITKADKNGKIIYANNKFYEITGFSKEETIGQNHNIVRHPDTPSELFQSMWETIKNKKVWKGKLKNRGKKGDYWIDATITPILNIDDEIEEFIAIRHDITEIMEETNLDTTLNKDILIGCGNRSKLTKDLKNSKNPGLALINIDGFSQINDFFGPVKGDTLITELGITIKELLEDEKCKLYHLQGDEYVVFSKDTKKDEFVKLVKDLISKIDKSPICLDEEKIIFTITTSISFEPKEKIISSVNMALRVAKRENKHLIVYTEEKSLNKEYQNNIEWTHKVKEAITNDRIIPVFQPIINHKTKKWEKYEALVRIKDGEGGLISPYFFLDISKKAKLYPQITKIMIKKSFDMFKDNDKEFSLNLTIEDIMDKNIKNYIFQMLNKYKIGSRVVFEIVESESIEEFEEVIFFIERLRKYDCKIAIDDFGTGYSNFEYLVKIRPDYIKIDGSLVKDVQTNKDSRFLIKTIVGFAKEMDMKTVVEYVENKEILEIVQDLGVDYSQGYYFSEPKDSIDLKK